MPSLSEETGGRALMLMPGSTIGIIGGGQLGRMMVLSARSMGFRVGVLDPTPNCPTGEVAISRSPPNTMTKPPSMIWPCSPTCYLRVRERRPRRHRRGARHHRHPAGHRLAARDPAPRAREAVHQRPRHRHRAWRAVNNFDELDAGLDNPYPAVLKTVSGGYDGHGSSSRSTPTWRRSAPAPTVVVASAEHPGRLRRLRLRGFDPGLRQRQGLRHLPDCA